MPGLVLVRETGEGSESSFESSVVGNILPQGLESIDMCSTLSGQVAVLLLYALDPVFVSQEGVVPPPVPHVSLPIVLPTLVVEGVRELMAHDDSHGAVVEALGPVEVEERRLEDAGREDDLVLERSVVSVDGGRSHTPLVLLHTFVQFSQILVQNPAVEIHRILKVLIADFEILDRGSLFKNISSLLKVM